MNWYVMAASSIMLALVVTIITEKVIIHILGEFNPEDSNLKVDNLSEYHLTDDEKKGLRAAGIATIIFIIVLALLMVPQNAFFRDETGKLLPKSLQLREPMYYKALISQGFLLY